MTCKYFLLLFALCLIFFRMPFRKKKVLILIVSSLSLFYFYCFAFMNHSFDFVFKNCLFGPTSSKLFPTFSSFLHFKFMSMDLPAQKKVGILRLDILLQEKHLVTHCMIAFEGFLDILDKIEKIPFYSQNSEIFKQ